MKSISKIRHIEESNRILENRLLNEKSGNVKPLLEQDESEFQFTTQYFASKPTGTITFKPDETFPNLVSINGISINPNDWSFNENWNADGTSFGRGFQTGNGNYTYSFDRTNNTINLISAKDNINGSCKNNGDCQYLPK